MGPRIVFFDLETRKWASDLAPNDEEYGWELLRQGKGGISALAVYDTHDKFVHLYDDHTVAIAAKHLESAEYVVGYCSSKFDIPVIEGILNRKLRLRNHIDIYVDLVRGFADKGKIGKKGDFTLDTICKKNIGRGKSDHGSNAKQLAATGQWGKLFNYCADDVRLTRDLFYKMCNDGGLIAFNGKFMPLSIPDRVKTGIAEE